MDLLIKIIEKQQKSVDDMMVSINAKLDMLSTKLNNMIDRVEVLEKNNKHELIPFPDDFIIPDNYNTICKGGFSNELYDKLTQKINKYIKTKLYKRFDTSNVTNMSSMFSGCDSLTELDLSH